MQAGNKALNRYIDFYQTMQRSDLVKLEEIFYKQARFKDPFNEVIGIEAITAIFEDMFKTLEQPQFFVEESLLDEDIAYIKWRFTGALKSKAFEINGLSRVVFDSDGLVREHVDYWDASEQFYMKLPVIGPLLRWIQRRVSCH